MKPVDKISLRYEKLTEQHINEIMPFEKEAYPEPWTRGMFIQEISSEESIFFVALNDDTLIGYAGFWMIADEAHITSITVCKKYRGKGFGRQILLELLEKALEKNAMVATLEVRSSNHKAIKLYQNIGFTSVGVRKQYYPKTREDAIIMLKKLT